MIAAAGQKLAAEITKKKKQQSWNKNDSISQWVAGQSAFRWSNKQV